MFPVHVFAVPAVLSPRDSSAQSKFPSPVTPLALFPSNVLPLASSVAWSPKLAWPLVVLSAIRTPSAVTTSIPSFPPLIVFPLTVIFEVGSMP